MRRRLGTALGAALAISGILASSACEKARTAPVERPTVQALTIGSETVEVLDAPLRFSGVIEPYRRVDLAFRVGGYVENVRQQRGSDGRFRALEPGDFVRRGTVLAALRRTDYRARVDQSSGVIAEAKAGEEQARAQLAQSEAQLAEAEQDWRRAQVLFKAEAMTKPESDASKARYDALFAQTNGAREAISVQSSRGSQATAELSAAQVSLGDTELRSPLDAVVLARSIEVGTLASPGTVAFSLAEIDLVKTVFGVPDVDLDQVQQGARLSVMTDAFPGQSFTGIVTSIAPSADDRSRTYNVQLTLENPKLMLKPGMISSIALGGSQARESRLPVVPLTALMRGGQRDEAFGVYKVLENGGHYLHLQPVEIGAVRANQVTIAKGLAAGDRVLQSGGSQLSDGQQVNLAN